MTTAIDKVNADQVRAAIAAAEELVDPLQGLVERCKDDPGPAFVPDVLERLVALKKDDPASWESLRARLKKETPVRVTELDKAIAERSGTNGRGPTQTDILVELVGEADLFYAPDDTPFADIVVDGHRETWPVRAKGFRQWLARRYFEETAGAPNSEALQATINLAEARARFGGTEQSVSTRVGSHEGRLYLDLSDAAWRAVEIDTAGWRVTADPPVRFRRAAGMQALPEPKRGGSVKPLRSFLNVQSNDDLVLVVAWALACLRDCGPYPLLALSGEQGSAKSTFSTILRALLDPNTAPLRALPREERELFIAASNGHLQVFDNVSGVSPWISDAFCRLATGGGFAVRQLYTDQDEILFDAVRPVILNGIEEIVTRPDLADRALFLTLKPIPADERRPAADLWAEFEAERPRILGALLDAVVTGLRRLSETYLPNLPRLADFAVWATACETAIWPPGTFVSAYSGNRDAAVDRAIDADPVAAAVRALMTKETTWTGTATELLDTLARAAGEYIAKSKVWPGNARALSGRLDRVAPFLREIGIGIDRSRRGQAGTRIIRITKTTNTPGPENDGPELPVASVASAPQGTSRSEMALEVGTQRTLPDPADANFLIQSSPEKG
ncbi:MAG: hypothetical protein OXG19_04985 [Chloroflexi bacterium]|nr:hypothetical protein [Chloroflexota bacterium]